VQFWLVLANCDCTHHFTDTFTDSGRSDLPNSLLLTQQNLEARVGIGQLLGFQPTRLLHSQLSHSQTYRVTGIRTANENGLFCAFRQVCNYSITTRQRVQKNSSEDALLAILLALLACFFQFFGDGEGRFGTIASKPEFRTHLNHIPRSFAGTKIVREMSSVTPKTGTPHWPVRAVDCAHFAPPTQRTRRDGLV
jgi:hypothetical protein